MIIQCKNKEQYDLLAREPLTIPLAKLQIDIDEDYISKETADEFKRLGETK